MSAHNADARLIPHVFTIHPGAPFLTTLVEALRSGKLVPGFEAGDDPLALADVTIYVPTRRAARELRAAFAQHSGMSSAILPTIKALGEFDDGEAAFTEGAADALDLAPPINSLDRLLLLAPLARFWKQKLPHQLAKLYDEPVIVPASTADAIWLARDLAALMDEVELEGSDWSKLQGLVTDNLADWWRLTLDFLAIVTEHWPAVLEERRLSNPAAHRDALLRAEAKRLRDRPPKGPVIAAGSTGSIPGTAELLAAIANLPQGAVVLPGLDKDLDAASWAMISRETAEATVFGHPQFGLAKLLRKLRVDRDDVDDLATIGQAQSDRAWLVSEAMRPAEATETWLDHRKKLTAERVDAALEHVELAQAANERDEAAAIAVALCMAIEEPGKTAALVTADRNLARRVSTELLRFGVKSDDSGGTPLANRPPATLLRLLVGAVFTSGDPVGIVALIKHPLLRLGLERAQARDAAQAVELIALRGGVGRPDATDLVSLLGERLRAIREPDDAKRSRPPHWLPLVEDQIEAAELFAARLTEALAPLAALRDQPSATLSQLAGASVQALEALGRNEWGALDQLYAGDDGAKLIEFLRKITGASVTFEMPPADWPSVLEALIAPEAVKPAMGGDPHISIWGALEARLQNVDTLVLGGLNEGSWPRKAQSDQLMSRLMKSGIDLEPPERRIGLAAHDFQMAMGAKKVILTRSARDGDAPSVMSRWLQRLSAFLGEQQTAAMAARGEKYVRWGRQLDSIDNVKFAPRPNPTPPLRDRPTHFSVTEIETLRRDPYAIYARKVLGLKAIEPLIRDPNAAERGNLFHDIVYRFAQSPLEADDGLALTRLFEIGRKCFDAENLPRDVRAVWWPRFAKMAPNLVEWERERSASVLQRHSELRARATKVGSTGVTLSGVADRIDIKPAGYADVLDFKTGSNPSKAQAHTLLSPQLPLEAALLMRGAFEGLEALQPDQLDYVRLKADGGVNSESILSHSRSDKSGPAIAAESWARLEELLHAYRNLDRGYLSRALPFRETDLTGDYDHLARVLEWSNGDDDGGGE